MTGFSWKHCSTFAHIHATGKPQQRCKVGLSRDSSRSKTVWKNFAAQDFLQKSLGGLRKILTLWQIQHDPTISMHSSHPVLSDVVGATQADGLPQPASSPGDGWQSEPCLHSTSMVTICKASTLLKSCGSGKWECFLKPLFLFEATSNKSFHLPYLYMLLT